MKNLLLIPGLLGSEQMFKPFIQALKHKYIITSVPINSCDDIEFFSKELSQTINHDTIIIGFSLGAWIALSLYYYLKENCSGLVLISSAPGSLKASTKRLFASHIEHIQKGHFNEFISADFKEDVAKKNQAQLKSTFYAMMQQEGPDTAIKQLKSMMNPQLAFDSLADITTPTLLIRGTQDNSLNTIRQNEMEQLIPKAKLISIENAAHYVPLENPIALAQAFEQWLHESYSRETSSGKLNKNHHTDA